MTSSLLLSLLCGTAVFVLLAGGAAPLATAFFDNSAEGLAALDGEILVQHGAEVADGYLVRGTPAAVLVDAQGRIAAPLAVGTYAIRELLEATT